MADLINSKPNNILESFQTAYYNQIGQRMQMGQEEMVLSSIFSTVLAQYAEAINISYRNQNLTTATGEYLDAIGARYNLTRSPETFENPWFEGSFDFNPECEYYEQTVLAGGLTIVIGGHTYTNENVIEDAPEQVDIRFVCNEKHSDALSKSELLQQLSELKDSNGKRLFTASCLKSYRVSNLQSVSAILSDDAFREYIKKNMFLYTPGVAPAFEAIAEASSEGIEDAKVRVQGETGFVPGHVDLFCKPLYMHYDQTLGVLAITYDMPKIQGIIEKRNVLTIGQTLTVSQANNENIQRHYAFYVPAAFAGELDLYKLKFASVVGYFNKHILNMGVPFAPTSILTMMVQDLSAISNDPEDFGWWPEYEGYQKWDQYKALPVIGLKSVNLSEIVNVDPNTYIFVDPFPTIDVYGI